MVHFALLVKILQGFFYFLSFAMLCNMMFQAPSPKLQVFVFGNLDLQEDNLPMRILPKLKKRFPNVGFVVRDPHEEWDIPENMIVLDTVVGIKDVRIFSDLKKFQPPPRVSMHDFDAYANLRLLQKLGKLKKINIIGVPPMMSESEVVGKVIALLRPMLS